MKLVVGASLTLSLLAAYPYLTGCAQRKFLPSSSILSPGADKVVISLRPAPSACQYVGRIDGSASDGSTESPQQTQIRLRNDAVHTNVNYIQVFDRDNPSQGQGYHCPR